MRTYFHIPTDVKEWPTDNPEAALGMASAVRDEVKKFITESELDAMAVLATNDKCAQISGGDPEVVKAIEDFVSKLLSDLVKEQ